MKNIRKILTYCLILLIIIGGGILTGRHLSSLSDTAYTDKENLALEKEKQQKAFEKKLKKADYVVAPPHFGPLIKSQDINVTYNGETAYGYLPLADAANTNTGQDVILFDTEDYVLPLGAKISNVETDENTNQSKITIKLPEGTKTEFLSPNLSIITLETKISKRIPLSALNTDSSGENYIWMAKPNEQNKIEKLTRQTIQKGLVGDEYFEETTNRVDTYDLIVINPDDKISSDKKYDLVAIELNAPIQNPIETAWTNFELNRLNEQQDRLNKIADDCRNGVYTPTDPSTEISTGFTNSGSCGGSTTDPLAIFNSLTNNAGSNGGSACGSCGQ